jgi:hypothetical protein
VLAGHRLGSCQISHRRLFRALLLCCACAAAHGVEREFRACRHQGLVVTRGTTQQLYPVTVSHSGHTNEYVHNVSSRATWCTRGPL